MCACGLIASADSLALRDVILILELALVAFAIDCILLGYHLLEYGRPSFASYCT